MRDLTDSVKDDGATALLCAIGARFVGLPGLFTLHEIESRPWSSVTFSGARHELEFSLEGTGAGAAADSFVASLDASRFELRGHVLADVALLSDKRLWKDGVWLRLEALTVIDS